MPLVVYPLTYHTDLTTCCRSNVDNNGMGSLGQWTYPDRSGLLNNADPTAAGQQFYFVRNDAQLITLQVVDRTTTHSLLATARENCCYFYNSLFYHII